MPDDNATNGRDAQQTAGGRDAQQTVADGSKYSPTSLDEAMKIITALEKRVGEREEHISGLKQRVEAIEAASKRTLEQTGNWEQLAKERAAEVEALKQVADRAMALDKIIREGNEARMGRIPEAMRPLIPTDYAPEKLQAWLNANEARLTTPLPPRYDAGAGTPGGSRPSTLTPEQEALAKRFGLTAEEFAKQIDRKNAQGG